MTMISVAMVVHNGERFLRDTIESVLNQTHRDFEFVIVDDGSTDRTPDILARYAALDPRIVIVHQENRGVSAARNRAIAAVRHELVAWIDSDDLMLPDRLERQLAFLADHRDAAVISSFGYFINAFGKRIGKSHNMVDVEGGCRLLEPERFLEIIQSSVLFRRKDVIDVGGYSEQFSYAEDRDLWGRIVTAGKIIACQPEALVQYRLHSGSVSMKKALRRSRNYKFIDINIVRRLQGKPDFSYEEFQQWRRRRPFWQRLNSYRLFYAVYYFKNATRYYGERKIAPLLVSLGIALAMRPVHFTRQLVTRLA